MCQLTAGFGGFFQHVGQFIAQKPVNRGVEGLGNELQTLHIGQRVSALPIAHALMRDVCGSGQLGLRQSRRFPQGANARADLRCDIHLSPPFHMGQSENTARANQRSSWHAMQLIPSSADAAILPTNAPNSNQHDTKASLHSHSFDFLIGVLQLMNGPIVHKLLFRRCAGIKMEDMNGAIVHILQKAFAISRETRTHTSI